MQKPLLLLPLLLLILLNGSTLTCAKFTERADELEYEQLKASYNASDLPHWVVGRSFYGFWREFRRNRELIDAIDGRGERTDLLIYGDSVIAWNKPMNLSMLPGSREIWDKNFGDLNAEPLGIPGDRLTTVVWRLAVGNERPKIANPKVIIIFIGTNDAVHKTWNVDEKLDFLLDWLATEMPDTWVVVQGLLPGVASVNRINSIYRMVTARRGIMFTGCLYNVRRFDPATFIDDVHLTPHGMHNFLHCLRKRIQPLIDNPRVPGTNITWFYPNQSQDFAPGGAPGMAPAVAPSLSPPPLPTPPPAPVSMRAPPPPPQSPKPIRGLLPAPAPGIAPAPAPARAPRPLVAPVPTPGISPTLAPVRAPRPVRGPAPAPATTPAPKPTPDRSPDPGSLPIIVF